MHRPYLAVLVGRLLSLVCRGTDSAAALREAAVGSGCRRLAPASWRSTQSFSLSPLPLSRYCYADGSVRTAPLRHEADTQRVSSWGGFLVSRLVFLLLLLLTRRRGGFWLLLTPTLVLVRWLRALSSKRTMEGRVAAAPLSLSPLLTTDIVCLLPFAPIPSILQSGRGSRSCLQWRISPLMLATMVKILPSAWWQRGINKHAKAAVVLTHTRQDADDRKRE